MTPINENFAKLPGSYLFSTVAGKVAAYQEANPQAEIIRLGIGDVTRPLVPAVIEALHEAVGEMGRIMRDMPAVVIWACAMVDIRIFAPLHIIVARSSRGIRNNPFSFIISSCPFFT